MPKCCGFCRKPLGIEPGQRTWEYEGDCDMCQRPICDQCYDDDEHLDGFQVSPFPGEYLCYHCQSRVKDCPQCFGYLTERMGDRSDEFEEPCPLYPHRE